MKTVTTTAVLPCTPETFWKVFLDERYTRALFLDELQFKELTVLELTESSRKLRLVPKLNLPGPLQKLVGDSFAYEEHGTLDRARNEWTWRMVPRKEIVATRGKVRIEATGDGQCRRFDEVVIEGKIFGLGGVIESTAEKEVRASAAKELAFAVRWLEKQKQA
ncbi:MAG: hypothetical protein JWM53_3280 [bacterium]|nr:hypothetical protein [bacterium]